MAGTRNLPLRLAKLHHRTSVGQKILFSPPTMAKANDGRKWPSFEDLATGAGFSVSAPGELTRQWTLPDTVATNLHVLVCGLNPSPGAADSGVGFHKAGNRFWPAAIASGLVTQDRDAVHALEHHGVGMTDLVKRTTRKASELTRSEYDDGLARIERLTRWLQPRVICFVGLAGWRSAQDRHAKEGLQDQPLAGCPVYLMGSTSGLNANSQLPDFVRHLSRVIELAAQR